MKNVHTPGGGLFSISGFRLFGNGLGKAPDSVSNVQANQNVSDSRQVQVSWKLSQRADFYIVRYGISPDKFFNNYQVYDANECDINSLNAGVNYFFAVDAVNDSGIAKGKKGIPAK